MAVWLVRAGQRGERQDFALDEGLAVVGWDTIPDLTQFKTRDNLETFYTKLEPNHKPSRIRNWVGQLWAFANKIQIGDLIVLPLKGRSAVAIGRGTGPYQYESSAPSGAKHRRPVKWLTEDMPRSRFDQDLLYSLGAYMTVCQIKRNNAEQRIKAIVEGKAALIAKLKPEDGDDAIEATDDVAPPNLKDFSVNQIRTHIGQKFAGHRLADLVNAVLVAQGYQTEVSEPGPDGGVDIIAGRGPMGFDPPRLCVQVKSGNGQQDVKVLRELKGVMKDFGADQRLFIAWGGFKRTATADAKRTFFEIRLWDADDLVEAVLRHYDQFSEDLKADLPLKRIWTLVQEE